MDKIFKLTVTTARLKVKSEPYHDLAHILYLVDVLTKFQLPAPHSFQKIFKLKDTMARSMVKSRSHYGVSHLNTPTNVPTKF